MSRKNIVRAFRLKDDQSLAASFTTAATNVDYLDNIGFIVTTSGVTNNVGTFGVQVRLTDAEHNTSSDWVDLSLSGTPTLANANLSFAINLTQLPFSEVRLQFTAGGIGPDGTADVWIEVKEI